MLSVHVFFGERMRSVDSFFFCHGMHLIHSFRMAVLELAVFTSRATLTRTPRESLMGASLMCTHRLLSRLSSPCMPGLMSSYTGYQCIVPPRFNRYPSDNICECRHTAIHVFDCLSRFVHPSSSPRLLCVTI